MNDLVLPLLHVFLAHHFVLPQIAAAAADGSGGHHTVESLDTARLAGSEELAEVEADTYWWVRDAARETSKEHERSIARRRDDSSILDEGGWSVPLRPTTTHTRLSPKAPRHLGTITAPLDRPRFVSSSQVRHEDPRRDPRPLHGRAARAPAHGACARRSRSLSFTLSLTLSHSLSSLLSFSHSLSLLSFSLVLLSHSLSSLFSRASRGRVDGETAQTDVWRRRTRGRASSPRPLTPRRAASSSSSSFPAKLERELVASFEIRSIGKVGNDSL